MKKYSVKKIVIQDYFKVFTNNKDPGPYKILSRTTFLFADYKRYEITLGVNFNK